MTADVGANPRYQSLVEPGFGVSASARRVVSALVAHVPKVLRLRTDEEMLRVDATGVVAAMTHHQPGRKVTEDQAIGDAMRQLDAPVVIGDLAVASLLGRCELNRPAFPGGSKP